MPGWISGIVGLGVLVSFLGSLVALGVTRDPLWAITAAILIRALLIEVK